MRVHEDHEPHLHDIRQAVDDLVAPAPPFKRKEFLAPHKAAAGPYAAMRDKFDGDVKAVHEKDGVGGHAPTEQTTAKARQLGLRD